MKRLLLYVFLILLALPLAGCGRKSSPRDFYSMVREAAIEHPGTCWLGMTREEVFGAVWDMNSGNVARVRYQDDLLASVTSMSQYIHPVGVTFEMTRDEVKAFYAKDAQVMVTEEANLLTFTKTIDGTVYYVRYVLYKDDTIKEINQTTDPELDEMQFPRK